MITLSNFEDQVAERVVARGREYFDGDTVTELDELVAGHWQAQVTGSDDYSVAVIIKKNGAIAKCACDCPYDGEICKHIVAVLFCIREQWRREGRNQRGGGSRSWRASSENSILKNAANLSDSMP